METKVCNKCKQEKPVSEFYKDKSRRDGLCGECKSCRISSVKRWKKNNPKKVTKQKNRRQKKVMAYNRDWVLHQLGGKCVDCDIQYDGTNSSLFDVHHLIPSEKEYELSGHHIRKSKDRIQKELDKCVLLCKNHHRKRHSDYKKGLRDTL